MQLLWAGDVTRMEDVCVPQAVFFSELQEGKRGRGAQRKRYERPAEETACTGGNQLSVMARSSVRKASRKFEAERQVASRERRWRQKKTSVQHPSHPQPKPPRIQSAVGCVHQGSVTTATNERARTDHQPYPQKFLVCEE